MNLGDGYHCQQCGAYRRLGDRHTLGECEAIAMRKLVLALNGGR